MLHLHVGMGRSGSSSIQHFLRYESEDLTDILVYPEFDLSPGRKSPANGHAIVTALGDDATTTNIFKEIESSLIDAEKSKKAMVISSEFLFHLSQQQIALLGTYFGKIAPKLTVHVYVRDLYDWHLSLYRQRVKSKCWTISAQDYMDTAYVAGKTLQALEWYKETFGDRLNVYMFSKSHLKGGDVRLDFLNRIGIPNSRISPMPKEVNQSPTIFEIEVMRRMNLLVAAGAWETRSNRRFLKQVGRLGLAFPGVELVPSETREKFYEAAAPEVREINARFCLDLPTIPKSLGKRTEVDTSQFEAMISVIDAVITSIELPKQSNNSKQTRRRRRQELEVSS